MKSNKELRAALDMVAARLDSNPRSPEEWQAIVDALRTSTAYAEKCLLLRGRLAAQACPACGGALRACSAGDPDMHCVGCGAVVPLRDLPPGARPKERA